MSAVMQSGSAMLMSAGNGLRQTRRRSLASRTRSMLLAQVAARKLEEHVVQAGALERDVFHAHREVEQILQALGRITRAHRGDGKLAPGFLNDAKALMETGPRVGRSVLEIGFQHEHAVTAKSLLQFA